MDERMKIKNQKGGGKQSEALGSEEREEDEGGRWGGGSGFGGEGYRLLLLGFKGDPSYFPGWVAIV